MEYRNLFKEAFNIVKNTFITKEDKVNMKGIFELETKDENGNTLTYFKDDNIIVSTSFTILKNLFVDGDINHRINTLKLGDGGVFNSIVKIPIATETDLFNPLTTKEIPEVYTSTDVLVDPLNKTIRYTWNFDTSEANGAGTAIYTEAGLFSDNGIMFSKKNFTEVVKNDQKEIIVNWTIRF